MKWASEKQLCPFSKFMLASKPKDLVFAKEGKRLKNAPVFGKKISSVMAKLAKVWPFFIFFRKFFHNKVFPLGFSKPFLA